MKLSYPNIKFLDYIIFFFVLTAIAIISLSVYGGGDENPNVIIQTDEGTQIYSLSQDRTIRVTGPLGETVIEISDGMVHVVSSPCRDKLCILKGDLEDPGDWTACMPNRVFISIGGKKSGEVDDVSY